MSRVMTQLSFRARAGSAAAEFGPSLAACHCKTMLAARCAMLAVDWMRARSSGAMENVPMTAPLLLMRCHQGRSGMTAGCQ